MGAPERTEQLLTPRRTTLVSIAAAAALVALKLGVGLATGSLGLISAGIESSGDVIAAVLTFFAVRLGGRPADRCRAALAVRRRRTGMPIRKTGAGRLLAAVGVGGIPAFGPCKCDTGSSPGGARWPPTPGQYVIGGSPGRLDPLEEISRRPSCRHARAVQRTS